MGFIRVLSEGTINQIAAGEVIENPASVIKELVENSLDAGAKKIWIEIRGGGFQLIQVADDGVGMNRDDAVLCVERHSTSKMHQIEDLSALQSMGFRGEALASIAAVSKMDIVTAQEGRDAVEVEMDAGSIRGVRPASRARGTTISIRSLFYNVPARKKFQKSVAAINSEIHKLIFALALAYPEVEFELVGGETVLLSVIPENTLPFLTQMERRIEALFGGTFLQGRRSVSYKNEGYELCGWIGSPVDDRLNRSGQYLFVNRRVVVSPLISAAIKAGYGHRLDDRRYPIFALHLAVPPAQLDVNVHPQKREVRFQNEEWLKQFLQEATRAAFQEVSTPLEKSAPVSFATSFTDAPLRFREEAPLPSLIEEPVVIGLFGHYLLLEDEGVVWVHLQKARELVLLRSLHSHTSVPHSQGLLIPIPLALNRVQQGILQEKHSILHQIGFSIDRSGTDHFMIHATPPFIEASDAAEAVLLILEGEDVCKDVVAFATRGKKRFMLQEALALWHQVKGSSDPAVIAKMEPDVIERLFK